MLLDQNGYPLPVVYDPAPHEAVIWLSRGYSALIDADDYPVLSPQSWYAHVDRRRGRVYARSRTMGYMHRMLVANTVGKLVDHWNNDPLDNRKDNLRLCDHSSNAANYSFTGKVEYRGVTAVYRKGATKYRARLQVMDKRLELGTYDTPERAARKYDKAAREHFGEFAWVNFRRFRAKPPTEPAVPF